MNTELTLYNAGAGNFSLERVVTAVNERKHCLDKILTAIIFSTFLFFLDVLFTCRFSTCRNISCIGNATFQQELIVSCLGLIKKAR